MDDQTTGPIESAVTDETAAGDEEGGGLSGRAFMGIAAVVLAVGLSIGGAFAVGVQVGQGQQEDVEEVPPLAITAEEPAVVDLEGDDAEVEMVTFGPDDDREIPPEVVEAMREQGVTEADLAQMRLDIREFQGGEGAGFPRGRPGFSVGTGDADNADIGTRINGTVQSIDGNVITLMTPTGPQRIATIAGTQITVTQSGEIGDLDVGDRVTVAAVPGPDEDILEAASITAVGVEE